MSTSSHHPVHVWDWSVRVFHWSLPILLFLLWRSAGDDMEQHMLFAQLLLGLLLYRIIWGFIGTPYARFGHFIYHPGRIIAYLRATLAPQKPVYLSHNPLGGVMVLVMLGTLLFQAGTGLFATDDIFSEGPLYSYVSGATTSLMTDWHKSWFYQGLLLIIGLHILAIVLHRLRGEGLVKAMITGHKEAPADRVADQLDPPTHAFPWPRFILAVSLAAGTIWALFNAV
ncbi:cytochrome b/b6 domain-containing protein [Oceanisphaera arctica]|uniref:Cytochrome B n=1 Tax=Oceanisphaera arctica TaxID=641510 RepID=A0A2P5TJH0_9GAMM|nr:cytochrome b/b6 domain-containing protein [Oceanisphaera arctica]PPL15117.1 cytochrome B [Oceanisphaera arctica]GHA29776.1 cytochrome b561 [Oceanisphaera arctica]